MVDMEDVAPPDDAAKFHFVEGCVPEIRTQLMVTPGITSLAAAMSAAERIGSGLTSAKGGKMQVKGSY